MAQLVLARGYGFTSWAALRTAIQRRRRLVEASRWSFGGATAIETAAGALSIAGLVSGPDHAILDAWLLPAEQILAPSRQTREELLNAALLGLTADRQTPGFDDVTIIDDRGTHYTVRLGYLSVPFGQSGQPARLHLSLVPAPARECAWLELRNQNGATTRLWPSRRPTVVEGDEVLGHVSSFTGVTPCGHPPPSPRTAAARSDT